MTALECGASSPPEITYWYDKLTTTTPPTHFLKVADPYLRRIKSTGRLIFKANLELKKFRFHYELVQLTSGSKLFHEL